MIPAGAPRGNWATLLLPLQEDDSIDEDALIAEIDAIAGFGVDGVYSNGTAGEFYNQTEQEFDLIQGILSARCRHHGLPFQIGISHPFPAVALERAARCRALRPNAYQVILPDWFPPTFEEIVSFLSRIAAAADGIPLVLYNPPHAKVRLDAGALLALSLRVPALIGVKVPGGDEAWYAEVRPMLDRVSLFVPGHTLATGARLGAHGAYSNVACIHPGVAQQWWRMIASGDAAALEWESRIQRFMREAVVPYIAVEKYSNSAVDKLMAAAGGWTRISSRLRWPYRWLGEDAVMSTRHAIERIIPEFLHYPSIKDGISPGGSSDAGDVNTVAR